MRPAYWAACLAVAALLLGGAARAQTGDGGKAAPSAPPSKEEIEAQVSAAWQAAAKTATLGPSDIKLLDQATMTLRPDEAFVPKAEANGIMTAMGNGASPARYGLVVSRTKGARWLIDVRWVNEGYVKDDDAKEWQADTLLESLKEGTEKSNTDRERRGIPALEVVGWVQAPAYDATLHRLVWSLSLRNKGDAAGALQTINYNTYALGREGFFSLNLITRSDAIATDKDVVEQLLGTLTYGAGKRYQDFDQSTDRVAAYGLAALIGAVAVKKIGLLAGLGVLFLKLWKVGLIALAGLAAGARRFMARRKPPAANT
jgi:uncharacterized membrane-anchored protein